MMKSLTERLSKMLQTDTSEACSSVSYAIMMDGEILARDSMGKNPLHTGTYNVGSVSKVYCAVAVMQLVESGRLELDRPVCDYLPRFTMPDERYRQITLRHCLNHSSGLPGTQWRYLQAGELSREFYYEEVYQYLAHSALHSTPGEYSVYCNDGFTLAEMVVAAVSGVSYGEYLKKYITDPIGACSSRQPSQRNENFTPTFQTGMPVENIGPEGAGGMGTTMEDLCKFGQLFLTENNVISEKSKAEINKPQGVTILQEDQCSVDYGLGWDSVRMEHQNYSLGSGVLDKGGSTLEFSSRLMIIPKYQAVLAISATVDCRFNVKEEILQLFAAAMLDKGVNISKKNKPIQAEMKARCEGLYLAAGRFLRVSMDGFRMDVAQEDSRGQSKKLYSNLLFDGSEFVWKPDHSLFFSQQAGTVYLMSRFQGKSYPMAVKADSVRCQEIPKAWNNRIGKEYIISNVHRDDMVGCMQMTGFRLNTMPEVPNLLVASFVSERRKEDVPGFEGQVTPYISGRPSDVLACGAVHIPYQAGRDLVSLCFLEKDGTEYCECSRYVYQDVGTLSPFCRQEWEDGQWNQVYVIQDVLKEPLQIPKGRRVLLFDKELHVVYDSGRGDTWKALEEGFISLI